MKRIGVVGASGQLGTSLMRALGSSGLALNRQSLTTSSLQGIIWAAGSAGARCTPLEAHTELSSIQRVLREANFSQISRIVLLSSGGTVYGNNGYLPKKEDDPLEPQSTYAQLKVKVEQEFETLCRQYGISLITLRLANVFSTRINGLVGTLLNRTAKGLPFELFVHPNSTKQYGHSDDYAQLIIRYLEEIPMELNSQVFNLYSPNHYSIHDILNIVRGFRHFEVIKSLKDNQLPIDSCELTTKFPDFIQSHNWLTLEDFVQREIERYKE